MATFIGLGTPQDFIGAAADLDTVTYRSNATAGVTVDILGGGAGFADGDTYTSIENFQLSDIMTATDVFVGSAADESVRGYAGFNIMDGGDGNDSLRGGHDGNVLTGGAGADTVKGGDGDDFFLVAAGDLVAGDRISGGRNGFDSIVLNAGGTGDIFDLSVVRYSGIDEIRFDTAGTLIVGGTRDAAITFGTAADGEIVHINNWGGKSENLQHQFDTVMTYMNNGIDQVTWDESGATVTAEINETTGLLEVAYTSLDGSTTTTLGLDAGTGAVETTLETINIGAGPGTVDGTADDDTFALPGTDGADVWGPFFTYAEQATTSLGQRASARLEGKTEIEAVINGGDGVDTIVGTSAGEALILHTEGTTRLVAAGFEQNFNSIEVFDMGGGDDVVNLTATTLQPEYTVNTLIKGGEGIDYLFGGAGNDTIDGGAGNDRLVGWKGDDELTGGADADRFLFAPDVGGGTDTITDFELGIDDIFAIGFGVDNYAAAILDGVLTVSDDGTDTTLTLTDGVLSTDIILQDVVGVTAGDFIFVA